MSPRCGPQMKISPQLYDMTRLLAIMRNNFLSACPIRLFYLSVWPWVVLEILTYLSTLRFLRAVHVQTDCNNYAYCGRLLE